MSAVLVTGASGFVGRALCAALQARHIPLVPVYRSAPLLPGGVVVGSIDSATDWRAALAGVDVIVHLAARVHVMQETATDPLAAFRAANVVPTVHLARQAMAQGVRRFVYVSSIKVNGEGTTSTPFRASDVPAPADPYGISKLEAETALRALVQGSAMELVVVRPPLVYGPGVGANFRRLMQAVHAGYPLPFGAIRNRRSMVALDNLVDFLIRCTDAPGAAGQTLLVSDDDDVSIGQLQRMLARSMGKTARALPIPGAWLHGAAALLGKSAAADRLLGSLQVDIGASKASLHWQPVIGMQAALDATVADFLLQAQRT